MIKVGEYNEMKVQRLVEIGAYMDDGKDGILLPKRFLPRGIRAGDMLRVFLYHDSEDRLIATTQEPKAVVGDIAWLRAVTVTKVGAFLDWGLMKDLFVPASKQLAGMRAGGDYLVKIYIDERTGRAVATEKIEQFLSNDELTVKELEAVELLVYRKTEIGYVMIINQKHTGMLHFNEVYREINIGDTFPGFIKKIRPDNKIDVAAGKTGLQRVEDEAAKILRLLQENDGYLPYHDKSDPEDIYSFFGMSKKTFKMTLGSLYKQRRIELTSTGFKRVEE